MYNDGKILVGRVIQSIELATDRQAIRFNFNAGDSVIARCDADCCSLTWIEDIINPEAAIGAEVITVGDLDLPEELRQTTKTGNYEEEMAYYGFYIETGKGRCTIAYRNSSNGYYGGSLSWPGDHFYGGVHDQNVSNDDWKNVIEGD